MDDLARAQAQLGRALDRARAGEDRLLAATVREEGERLVKLLNGVLAMARLHAPDNRAFDQPTRDLAGALARLVALLGPVHLLAVEDQIYVNEIRIRLEGTEAAQDLGGRLRRHAVGGISFHAPLAEAPLRRLAAALAASPDPDRPRPALETALGAQGVDSVELVGIHRFRLTGEKDSPQLRDPRTVAAAAGVLADEALGNLAASRAPNPLPLRRVVVEILEGSTAAEALWDETDGVTPYAAHTVRVCRLALLLGRALGLAEDALQDLGVAAMLHDVGYAAREGAKVGEGHSEGGYAPPFPRHGAAGARLLLRQRGFHEAKVRRVLAALDHHRRYDDPGGAPTLFGRILAIAEDYDTLTRPGGGGLSPADALPRLAGAAGTVHDPALVQLLVNALGRFPPGTLLALADGRLARVVSLVRSPETFAAPLVRVERLANGEPAAGETVVDLASQPELRPTCVSEAPRSAEPRPPADEAEAAGGTPALESGAGPEPSTITEAPAAAAEEPPAEGEDPPGGQEVAAPFTDWTPLPDEGTAEQRPAPRPTAAGVLSAAVRPLFPGAVSQLLREIHAGKRSGFLTLIRGHERRGVRFWNGSIMYGRSTVHEEQMGGLGVELGLFSEEDLERASGIARRENERLGEVLCGLGLITTDALKDLVARHARQVLEKALPWTKGSYQFEPTSEEPTWFERMPSSLSTADIILDAARAIGDPEVIAWHLGDLDRVVIPAEQTVMESDCCRLTAFDGFVLSRADGRLSAREIVSIVPTDTDDVLRALFGLMCIGFVRYASRQDAAGA